MMYEELIEEIRYRLEELGGIGKHPTEERAKRAHAFALATIEKLEATARELRAAIEGEGYERYLAK